MNRKQLLANIKQAIHQRDPDAEIILFGSRVRGDHHTDSDWDILILTNEAITYELESEFRDPIFDLELDTGEVISMLVYSKKDWDRLQDVSPLFVQVNKEGVSI